MIVSKLEISANSWYVVRFKFGLIFKALSLTSSTLGFPIVVVSAIN